VLVAPASANMVAMLAPGISDNQALATANEVVDDPDVPLIVFLRESAAHIRHPGLGRSLPRQATCAEGSVQDRHYASPNWMPYWSIRAWYLSRAAVHSATTCAPSTS
jgi:hypothetical protein